MTLNNRILAKDTEKDLFFKPSVYRQQMKEKAEHIVQRKKNLVTNEYGQMILPLLLL